MKQRLPLLLGFLAGMLAFIERYIPAAPMRSVQSFLLETAMVLAAAAFVLGAINVVQVNVPLIQRRRDDWQYKLVLIVSAAAMLLAGVKWTDLPDTPLAAEVSIEAADGTQIRVIADRTDAVASLGGSFVATPLIRAVEPGSYLVTVRVPQRGYVDAQANVEVKTGQMVTVRAHLPMRWGPTGRVYTWLYDHVFSPCNATMFALLAFFIASAAFRAFRARNVEAGLLLGAAILIMIGRVPIGRALSPVFPAIAEWIVDIPNNAGRRAIMMGAALGAIATSLRVILGLERSHLGRDS
jgi:hypothetical protein